jgi:hypothetical protein
MDRIEIIASEASGEAVFLEFKLKWLSAFKRDKMVTRGRLSIHLQKAPKLSKEWRGSSGSLLSFGRCGEFFP